MVEICLSSETRLILGYRVAPEAARDSGLVPYQGWRAKGLPWKRKKKNVTSEFRGREKRGLGQGRGPAACRKELER